MSYLGRKGAVAPLTSADIPVGIVEGTDIAFLENASGTQNLGGIYSTERMYLNDSYTLTGDVTITGHLALGSVADSDVVITQDSTERTITGSGTLESGDLLHRAEDSTDLTGMTGELGSAVTGGSGLNVNSGITVSDQWVINANRTSGDITGNWVRPSSVPAGFGVAWSKMGVGLTESSGVFTFPVTGLYIIYINVVVKEMTGGSDANAGMVLKVTSNNGSDYYSTLIARAHAQASPDGANTHASNMGFINVNSITGASTVKFYLTTDSLTGDNVLYGDASTLNTGFSIFRIGSSQ